MKFRVKFICLSMLLAACSQGGEKFAVQSGSTELVKAKNVIFLIADGQSVGVTSLLRWYQGGGNLAVDAMAGGLVRTHNADTPIADSAPAGTALATGHKSHTGFIGVLPDEATLPGSTAGGQPRRPVASVLEAARLAGKSTGIIATSEIMHATPAAFTAHYPSRKAYDELSEQQVYQNLDLIMGGGYRYFTPAGRKDGKDLVAEFQRLGYQIARNGEEMDSIGKGKIWGAFAETAMDYHFDKPDSQPSLARMTSKAISLLSQNSKGFFLMVEGSKVDWAAHANDPAGLISDSLAFDEAVAAALDFARKDGNTIVIALTDHGNSGITMGNTTTSTGYDLVKLEEFMEPLHRAKLTAEGIARLIEGGGDGSALLARYFGISNLSPEERASFGGKTGEALHYALGPILAARAKLGFTSRGHSGEDVPLYSYLPGDKRITGVLDNTDIAKYAAAAMGLSLSNATARLFSPVESWKDVQAESDGSTLTLRKGKTLVFTKNKNTVLVDGKEALLEGFAVYNGASWFVPARAEKLFN